MLPLAIFVALATNAAPVTVIEPPSDGIRLTTADVTERIELPRSVKARAVSLQTAPFDRLIILRVGVRDVASVAAKIAAQAATLCPDVRIKGDAVELVCRQTRFDAALSEDNGQLVLDIHELRGMPWRNGPDGPPLMPYLSYVAIGDPCPGVAEAVRGECEFAEGHWMEAARHFRRAMRGRDKALAALRLGDLALIAADPAMALAWYERASVIGPFGRMAVARLCELDAACFNKRPKLDHNTDDLPVPLWADLTMRWARIEAFANRPTGVIEVLAGALRAGRANETCDGAGIGTCRRLLLFALRNTTGKDSLAAIEVYLHLPHVESGILAVELSRAVAEATLRLGAPVFGANLLASMAGGLDLAPLNDHLARTAELYLIGKDYARARVILEFARSRLVDKALQTPRWATIRRSLALGEQNPGGEDKVVTASPADDAEAAADLAAALTASADAKALVQKLQAKPPSRMAAAAAKETP